MNIKFKKFWGLFVFFVFFYYLIKLTKNNQRPIHTTCSSKLSQNLSILFCVPLNIKCKKNFTKYGNFKETKNKNEIMQNLICNINQNVLNNPKHIIEEAEKWNFFDAFNSMLKNTIKKYIILYNYQLCANYDLILNSKTERYHLFKFSLNDINVKIYLYPADKINLFYGIGLFTFKFNENGKYISSLFIKLIKIINLDYKKNCLSQKTKAQSCFIISCYQDCFSSKVNSYKFFYTKKDDFIILKNNITLRSLDQNCFKGCIKNFHGYYYYLKKINFENKTTKEINFEIDSVVREIKSKFLISNQLFFLEISSLLGVFLGFNYLDFSLSCLSELTKIFRIKKKSLIRKIEFFLFLFALGNLILSSSRLIQDYNNNMLMNVSTSFFPISISPFSFSPCFDVKTIINKKISNSFFDFVKPLEKNNIYSLNIHTLTFENLLNKSYVRFITFYKPLNIYEKDVKTFFMSEWDFNNTKLVIYKCFFIQINVNLSLVQNLLERSYVEILFNKPTSFYFLTAENVYPNSETQKVYKNTKYTAFETILEGDQSILSCKNYKKKCFSQKGCIDKCFVSQYLGKFFKLPSSIPIVENWFKNKWFYFLSFHSYNTENSKRHLKLKNFCLKSFPLVDCHYKNYKTVNRNFENATKKVVLFLHDTIRTDSKIILINKHELFFNIITCINIWLGLNLPKVIKKFFVKTVKQILSINRYNLIQRSSFNKFLQLIINLILVLSLSYNLYLTSNAVIKQKKITSVKYKILYEIEYPVITFCLDYRKNINSSKIFKLSGSLLDKLTFSANDIFKSVSYLDNNLKMNVHTDFNKIEIQKSYKTFKLSHFYFMKYKCFKMKNKVKLPFYYFYIKKKDSNFLTVKLKKNITDYYFTLGTDRSFNFNHFKKNFKQNTIIYLLKLTVEYRDLYSFLKDLLRFFKKKIFVNFNEASSYTNFIKKELKKSKNVSTLMLPLDEEYFNLTINDNEFLKFYKTKMAKLEKENMNNNYLREYYFTVYSQIRNSNKNQLKFKPKFFSTETIIKDKIPIENFFLIILNIISSWLNFSLINIFDQLNYFQTFYHLFIFFISMLNFQLKKAFYYLKNI